MLAGSSSRRLAGARRAAAHVDGGDRGLIGQDHRRAGERHPVLGISDAKARDIGDEIAFPGPGAIHVVRPSPAALRSPRRPLRSSLTRSGMVNMERRALGPGRGEPHFAAMGAHEFGGDREAEPGAARPRRALEGLEQLVAHPARECPGRCRSPRCVTIMPSRQARDGDGAVRGAPARSVCCALERLDGVAHQIGQDAENLVAVGIGGEILRHVVVEHDAARSLHRGGVDHFIDEQAEARTCRAAAALPGRGRYLSVCTHKEMARSSEAMSFGANFCTVGSSTIVKPVGDEMRRGEHVAQIVAHLAHREAERGQMRSSAEQR